MSKAFTLQTGDIPVFVKRATGRWEFCGDFEVSQSFSSGATFKRFIVGSGRSIASVSHVVLLKAST